MPQVPITNYKALVDTAITNKTAPNSITPIDEGTMLKNLADILDTWTLDFITDAGNVTTNNVFTGNVGVNTTSLFGFSLRVQGTTNLVGNVTVTSGDIAMSNNNRINWTGSGVVRTNSPGTLDIQGLPSETDTTANPALGLMRNIYYLSTSLTEDFRSIVISPRVFGLAGDGGKLRALELAPHLAGSDPTDFAGELTCMEINPVIGHMSNNAKYTALLISMVKPLSPPTSAQFYGIRQTDVNVINSFAGQVIVPPEAYGPSWSGNNSVPTKNDAYNLLQDRIVVVSVSAPGPYTITQTEGDLIVLVTGAMTVNLPNPVGNKCRIAIKRISTGTTTINPGAATIDGVAGTVNITTIYDARTFISDNISGWWLISQK